MKIATRMLAVLLCALPGVILAGPVNVNTADAETIAKELNGVGLAKAKAIVEYREKYGPFTNADELSLVKGIGERTVDRNRADILTDSGKD